MPLDGILLAIVGKPRNITGNALRAMLERWGWSQGDLAEHLDVERRTVVRWLSGETPIPGPVRAALLCWAQLDDVHRSTDRNRDG